MEWLSLGPIPFMITRWQTRTSIPVMREADPAFFTPEALNQRWRMNKVYREALSGAQLRADQRLGSGQSPRIINKIGLVITSHSSLLHYLSTIAGIDPALIELVLLDDGHDPDLIDVVIGQGLPVTFIEDLLNTFAQYAVGLTHSDFGLTSGPQTFPVARHMTRLVSYGFGQHRRTILNDTVSLFFCQGDQQAGDYRQTYPDRECLAVGVPRLDGLSTVLADKAGVARRYGLDPGKPTLVWMPTHSGPLTGAIELFAEALRDLAGQWNLALKPHNNSFQEPPDCYYLGALAEDGKIKVIRHPDDDADLFGVADVILADLGGSIYGALSADRDLIVTDVGRGNELSELDREIMRHVPILTAANFSEIGRIAADPETFRAQRQARQGLSAKLFTPGPAGPRIALTLMEKLEQAIA
jgi:hypothetical protein